MERRSFLLRVLLGLLIVTARQVGLSLLQINRAMSQTAIATTAHSDPITFFVAPYGDDAWSGRVEKISKNNDDGPFASLERAKSAIRDLKQQNKLNRPVRVIIAGGTYFLRQPLLFEPEDSGTESFPIVYQGSRRAIISGGEVITGWRKERVNDREMWTVTLPKAKHGGWKFQHLWVNGEKRQRSRYPSQGYLKVEALPGKTAGQPWHRGQSSFQYQQGDLPDISLQGGEAVVMNRWTESRLPVARVDPAQRMIYFDKESVFSLHEGDVYYLENVLEFLDTPGEWYLDSDRGKLYYYPLTTEKIESTEVIAPKLENLLIVRGSGLKNRYVEYLQFKNLAFSHTDWHLSSRISGYSHNAWGVSGAILANGMRQCIWENCTLAHLGNHAIELFRSCQDNQIVGCQMYDLGAGGVKIGERQTALSGISPLEVTHHNQITDNHIFDGGKFFPSAVGIRTVHSHHNVIARNHVHDFYYTGISARGTWGFKQTQAYKNIIEDNYVHHIGKLANGDGPILSDMGGIYTLGRQEGTVIRRNVIHDISAIRYGGRGIYLDEGSSYILIENNLVYDTTHGGFAIHYGKENLVRNNIFAYGKEEQIYRAPKDRQIAKAQNHISVRFEHNIFLWKQGILLGGVKRNPTANIFFDRNLYWKGGYRGFRFANMTWYYWRQAGVDLNSAIADPLFVAPEKGDFRLQSNSPALELGFNPDLIPLGDNLPAS